MVKVLEIKIYSNAIRNVIEEILDIIKTDRKKNYCISATGAHGIIYSKKEKIFKEVLNSFHINLPDGMPIVWIGRLKGEREMDRCYGPDFFRELIVGTKGKAINHYFCGGKENIANELKTVCREKLGNDNIVGTFSPPFREMSDEELIVLAKEIDEKHADIVWIGLSTPKQEIFAYRLSRYTHVHFLCTVGAAFDFHTGKVIQAPKLIQRTGLEWLFRLITEPRRLWKRYFEIVPKFIYYNLQELVQYVFSKLVKEKQ